MDDLESNPVLRFAAAHRQRSCDAYPPGADGMTLNLFPRVFAIHAEMDEALLDILA